MLAYMGLGEAGLGLQPLPRSSYLVVSGLRSSPALDCAACKETQLSCSLHV